MQVVEARLVFGHLGDEEVSSSDFFHEEIHDDCVGLGAMVFFHSCKDHVLFIQPDGEGAALYVAGDVVGDG